MENIFNTGQIAKRFGMDTHGPIGYFLVLLSCAPVSPLDQHFYLNSLNSKTHHKDCKRGWFTYSVGSLFTNDHFVYEAEFWYCIEYISLSQPNPTAKQESQ